MTVPLPSRYVCVWPATRAVLRGRKSLSARCGRFAVNGALQWVWSRTTLGNAYGFVPVSPTQAPELASPGCAVAETQLGRAVPAGTVQCSVPHDVMRAPHSAAAACTCTCAVPRHERLCKQATRSLQLAPPPSRCGCCGEHACAPCQDNTLGKKVQVDSAPSPPRAPAVQAWEWQRDVQTACARNVQVEA